MEKNEEINNININPEDQNQKIAAEKKPAFKYTANLSPKYKFDLLYNKRNKFHTSPFHYFLMSLSLLILSTKIIGWAQSSNFCKCVLTIIGISQYILGIFDFFQGNTIRSLFNFVFGIFNILFLFNDFEINGIKKADSFENPAQSIAFLILFWITICIFALNEFGLFNIFVIITLIVGIVFSSLWGFSDGINLLGKISGYAFFVCFVLFFLGGIALTINVLKQDEIIPLVLPGI